MLFELLVTGATAGALWWSRSKPRFLGDLAEKGDEAIVSTKLFPVPPDLLPGAGQIGFLVEDGNKDQIWGPFSAFFVDGRRFELTPQGIEGLSKALGGTQFVERSTVTALTRKGKPVTL